MVVPTIATIVVGTAGLVQNIGQANDADRTRTLSALSADAAGLVHALQDERAGAAMWLGNNVDGGQKAFDDFAQKTDEAGRVYRTQRNATVDGLPTNLSELLDHIDGLLDDLSGLRQQITSKQTGLNPAMTTYRDLINSLLGIRDNAAELAGGGRLGSDMRAAAALSILKENLSLERILGLDVLSKDALSPALSRQFMSALTGQEQAKQTFDNVAEQWQRDVYTRTVVGPDLDTALKLQGRIEELSPSERLPGNMFSAQQWDTALSGKANLVRKAEVELDRRVLLDATAQRDALQARVLVETAVLLGMLLLAILFAWIVARSMARSLRELRHGALTVAQYGLPQAVARLRDPALATQASPQELAQQIADPLPVRGRDEFGQVAEAFNAVHLEAVRTAAEQAALRASVATMFVNLARRSQILVDRLIGHLDRLERGEEDPDRLSELFQLDHLATRMRRNDENLLVLAGADSSRMQREPAPLMDVLRAAQSEVEHYTRIEFGTTDRDIEVGAHAVNDMVHLIAELLDNATAFSPPDSAVIVEARRVGDRAVLLVEDRGIGISPDQMMELNERLANPPAVDVAVSRMMGLVVVARLAVRHGVKVELRPGRERGTIADVMLPAGVLVPRAFAGRGGGAPPAPGQRDLSAMSGPPPRSALPAPLALEKGPAGPGAGPMTRGGLGASPLAGVGPAAFNGHLASGSGPIAPAARPVIPPPVSAPPVSSAPPAPFVPQGLSVPPVPPPLSVPPVSSVPPVPSAPPMPPSPQRGLPAWSDLTGAIGQPPMPPPAGSPYVGPLPQRRSVEPWGPDGDLAGLDGVIPRQRSEVPGADAVPPAPHLPVVPAGVNPPVWPPTSAPPADGMGSPSVFPPDATAEIPAVHLDWEPEPGGDGGSGYDGGESQQRFVDETMELPIFRELESAWFRTRKPGSPTSLVPGANGSAPGTPFETTSPIGEVAEQAVPEMPAATERSSVDAVQAWHTAADDGWQAAAALAEEQEFVMTETGLPKRVPMSQLVPGSVERTATATHRRTPEAVRGLLSAYHRGVQRGRSQQAGKPGDGKTPEPTTAGPQNSQGGKERDA